MSAGPLVRELEARIGLSFTGAQQARMLAAISAEADRCGCADEEAYAALVRADRVALDRLLVALTVTEGYFFRDSKQVSMLRATILPELAARSSGSIEVWSAGCGGGEEPHTVAMLGIEAGLGSRLRVLGTDVSVAAIDLARCGRYGAWSLRGVGASERATWFSEEGGRWEVRHDVRDLTRFAAANVLDGPPGRFDMVLCRNMLMYLTPVAVERASRVLAESLRPGGWLLTGASDPPLVSSHLVRTRTPHGLVYRRRRAEDAPLDADDLDAPADRGAAGAGPGGGHGLAVAPSGASPAGAAPSPQRPPPPASPTPSTEPPAADPDLHLAAAHYRAALAHLAAGRPQPAGREARAALYLDPGLAVAHLIVGHAARACGRPLDAVRSYRRGARALAALPADHPVACAEGHTAAHLAAVAARLAGDGGGRG